MLDSLRQEVDGYNKKIADINFELGEKLKKFTNNESKLSEPVPPPETLAKMEAKLGQLRATVSDLENRCVSETDSTKEEKLSIFRQQVALVAKKKAELEEEIESLNEERTNTEMMIEQKKAEIVNLSGKRPRPRLPSQNRRDQIPGEPRCQNGHPTEEASRAGRHGAGDYHSQTH
jgi:chromosome segregation ATPase